MDIRNWPIGKIMQLPDCCFGQRQIVSAAYIDETVGAYFQISEIGFPERCVIWEAGCRMRSLTNGAGNIGWKLGDTLPADGAAFDAMQDFLRGWGYHLGNRWVHQCGVGEYSIVAHPRMALNTSGQRLVTEFTFVGTGMGSVEIWVVFSAMPTEVPEWLISGQGRGL